MKFSGFMNVYQLDDMSWEYQFGEKSLKANTLRELEVLVSLYGLKWRVLDKDLAEKSLDADRNNQTGFLNVYKSGDYWHYRGSGLKSHSLEVLKKKALNENLEWRETDKDLAYKNLKLDSRKFRQ
ncbi:hypothetical protein TL18_04465 [Methanobrevibacter sp. YE315]|uniref:hypothetical protein n=1 Tax=Methanobrevibacter sp. YE315 TaxID=1609968 RepID=UPI000764E999|nr:hypothetical protein [Methanobrevibacter sp. YE315]AMD17341.1 hypothetical protein TL18_04465 [Methanobrevibacter sp. YE315]